MKKKRDRDKQEIFHEEARFENSYFPIMVRLSREKFDTRDTRLAYHREMEIQFIKSGKGFYFIKNRKYYFSKNTLFFIQPNHVHGFIPDQKLSIEKGMAMFRFDFLKARGKDYHFPEDFPNHLQLSDRDALEVEMIFDNILSEKKNKEGSWQELIVLQIKRLILIAKRLQEKEPERDVENPVIDWIVNYIEENFSEDLPLPEISEKAGYSQYYISRLFKKCTGIGIKQYILQRRILEAKLLLNENPEFTVDLVSRRVGFKEFSLFNRSFKKLTGITPSQYRKISYRNDKI